MFKETIVAKTNNINQAAFVLVLGSWVIGLLFGRHEKLAVSKKTLDSRS